MRLSGSHSLSWRFWRRDNLLFLPVFESRTDKPVAGVYTEYATPGPKVQCINIPDTNGYSIKCEAVFHLAHDQVDWRTIVHKVNELYGPFLDYLSYYLILKKVSTPWFVMSRGSGVSDPPFGPSSHQITLY
jgi:hypothetical protein